jgi:hypothetical protein
VHHETVRDGAAVAEIAGFFGLPPPDPEATRRILGQRANDHDGLRALLAGLRGGPPAAVVPAVVERMCGEVAAALGRVTVGA